MPNAKELEIIKEDAEETETEQIDLDLIIKRDPDLAKFYTDILETPDIDHQVKKSTAIFKDSNSTTGLEQKTVWFKTQKNYPVPFHFIEDKDKEGTRHIWIRLENHKIIKATQEKNKTIQIDYNFKYNPQDLPKFAKNIEWLNQKMSSKTQAQLAKTLGVEKEKLDKHTITKGAASALIAADWHKPQLNFIAQQIEQNKQLLQNKQLEQPKRQSHFSPPLETPKPYQEPIQNQKQNDRKNSTTTMSEIEKATYKKEWKKVEEYLNNPQFQTIMEQYPKRTEKIKNDLEKSKLPPNQNDILTSLDAITQYCKQTTRHPEKLSIPALALINNALANKTTQPLHLAKGLKILQEYGLDIASISKHYYKQDTAKQVAEILIQCGVINKKSLFQPNPNSQGRKQTEKAFEMVKNAADLYPNTIHIPSSEKGIKELQKQTDNKNWPQVAKIITNKMYYYIEKDFPKETEQIKATLFKEDKTNLLRATYFQSAQPKNDIQNKKQKYQIDLPPISNWSKELKTAIIKRLTYQPVTTQELEITKPFIQNRLGLLTQKGVDEATEQKLNHIVNINDRNIDTIVEQNQNLQRQAIRQTTLAH